VTGRGGIFRCRARRPDAGRARYDGSELDVEPATRGGVVRPRLPDPTALPLSEPLEGSELSFDRLASIAPVRAQREDWAGLVSPSVRACTSRSDLMNRPWWRASRTMARQRRWWLWRRLVGLALIALWMVSILGADAWRTAYTLAIEPTTTTVATVDWSNAGFYPFAAHDVGVSSDSRHLVTVVLADTDLPTGTPVTVRYSLVHPEHARLVGGHDGLTRAVVAPFVLLLMQLAVVALVLFLIVRKRMRVRRQLADDRPQRLRYVLFVDALGKAQVLVYPDAVGDGDPRWAQELAVAPVADNIPVAATAEVYGDLPAQHGGQGEQTRRSIRPILVVNGCVLWSDHSVREVSPTAVRALVAGTPT
jgi:hypothetical protein